MSRVKFGDVVKDVKINIDRLNNPYEYYVAGDHMDSEDLTIHRKGCFTTDDVGPAFIRVFKPGQILYGSRRTYLKKIAVADFEGVCANTTFVFETKDPHAFEQRLLPFIMLSKDFTTWSIAKSKGSTNPYVLFSDLADFEFELPPLEEQKVLVDKLWAAYRLKEAYKKLLVATDEMVKSQYLHRMAATEGFSIEISSRYDGWWRYNAALMCGCFDAGDERIGFASAESHVADVGANLTAKPADMAGDRSLRLETAACDHLLLYIYIVPHTLPAGNDIADTQPFEITLRIAYGGKVLRSEKRLINQWSGASVEMRVDRQDK